MAFFLKIQNLLCSKILFYYLNLMNELAKNIKNLPVEMIKEILDNMVPIQYYDTIDGQVQWFKKVDVAIVDYFGEIKSRFINRIPGYIEFGKTCEMLDSTLVEPNSIIDTEIFLIKLKKIHKMCQFDFEKVLSELKKTKVHLYHGNRVIETHTIM